MRIERLERRDLLSANPGDFDGSLHVDDADLVAWASDQGLTQEQVDWIAGWREAWGTTYQEPTDPPPQPHGPHPYLPTDEFFPVHLHDGGMERIPNFARDAATWTVAAGDWSDPAIWSAGVPVSVADAQVWHDVTISGDVSVDDLTVWEGDLSFADDASLTTRTLTVMPDGTLRAEGTGIEIAFAGAVDDADELGVGLIALGTVQIDGGDVAPDVVEIAPGVQADVARGVTLRTAAGSPDAGHVMFTSQWASVSVRDAAFVDLGRTTVAPLSEGNQVGRYSAHFHHGGGGGVFEGNVVTGTPKWGVTLHHVDNVQVIGNTIYDVGGAGIAIEAGREAGNRIEGNVIASVFGSGVRSPYARPEDDTGHHGDGIWTAAPENVYQNNEVYAVANAAFFLWDRKFNDRPLTLDGLHAEKAAAAVIIHGGNRLGDGTANVIRDVTGRGLQEGVVANYGGHFELTDVDLDGNWQKGSRGVVIGTHTFSARLENVVADRGWKYGGVFEHDRIELVDSVFAGDWDDVIYP